MFKKIVVPTDGSRSADTALDFAIEIAQSEHAALVICTVVDARQISGSFPQAGSAIGSWIEQIRVDARDILDRAMRRALAKGVSATGELLYEGPAAEAIVAFARRSVADAILMGTHGRSGFARTIMGSVAESVLAKAECAVITTRGARLKTAAA